MADFRAATATRQAMADAAADLVDAGSAAGTVTIYSGSVPSSPNDALSGNTQLAQLAMSDPAFAAADSSGIATANAITDDSSADADGTATFFRVDDSDGNTIFQGDVSDTSTGTGDLQFASTSLVSGTTVEITSFTITQPEI